VECNATASFAIAHHFLQILVSKQLRGCIVFTSSVAGFIPTPFAASYAATKAFVSQLACSLHIEVKSLGIDVCAVHPSPVASNFYEKVRLLLFCIVGIEKLICVVRVLTIPFM
jgi:short-subunit dehydrogenase